MFSFFVLVFLCSLTFGQSLDYDCGFSNQTISRKNNSSLNFAFGFTATILQSGLDAYSAIRFDVRAWIVNRSDGTFNRNYNGEQVLQAIDQPNDNFL